MWIGPAGDRSQHRSLGGSGSFMKGMENVKSWSTLKDFRAIAAIVVLSTGMGGLVQPAAAQNQVIGYYPMWGKANLPASQIRFDYLTQICHAFAWPLADGTITSYDASLDTAVINAAHRAGRKILISLGGAAESTNFPALAADTALRHSLVRKIVDYVLACGYDGADIDWEGQSTPNAAIKSNEVSLMRELRTAFDAQNQGWLLTMAIGAGSWAGQFHNYDSLRLSVDWFNVMTYDFHGSWSSHAGYNAPLYCPASDNNDGSVDLSITYMLTTRHVPSSQLVLGLPFYGIEFTATAMYQPFTGIAYITWPDVLTKLAHSWAYHWDAVSQVPYLTAPSNTKVDTFEDSTSLSLKCAYAKAKGLAGVMIWEITQDIAGGQQPLMEAVGLSMSGTSAVALSRGVEPGGFSLDCNYPNPFNPSTTIRYTIGSLRDAATTRVNLAIYDILGRKVRSLLEGSGQAGSYEVVWDGTDDGGMPVSSGMYIYRIVAGNFAASRSLVLLR